jgi:tripartite-type tricarboxylate transporter receptor subunit TctC
MTRFVRFIPALLAPLAAILMPLTAWGQAASYPNRPVRIMLAFAPGGATDTSARILASYLEKSTGQPHVVENRPGAFAQLATDAVTKSAPDGYTLYLSASAIATEPVINKQWTARLDRDLAMISMFVRFSVAIVVNAALPINNMREMLAWSKANPGKLTQAIAVTPSSDMKEIEAHMGLVPLDVPYKGGPATLQAVMTGDATYALGFALDILPLMQSGKIRAIAYMEKERHPQMPNVPTVAESGVGLDNFDAVYWYALVGPGGMPADITAKLHASVQGAFRDRETMERLEKLGMRPYIMSTAESRQRVLDEMKVAERRFAAGILKAR